MVYFCIAISFLYSFSSTSHAFILLNQFCADKDNLLPRDNGQNWRNTIRRGECFVNHILYPLHKFGRNYLFGTVWPGTRESNNSWLSMQNGQWLTVKVQALNYCKGIVSDTVTILRFLFLITKVFNRLSYLKKIDCYARLLSTGAVRFPDNDNLLLFPRSFRQSLLWQLISHSLSPQ